MSDRALLPWKSTSGQIDAKMTLCRYAQPHQSRGVAVLPSKRYRGGKLELIRRACRDFS